MANSNGSWGHSKFNGRRLLSKRQDEAPAGITFEYTGYN